MNRTSQIILGIVVLVVIGAGVVLATRHNTGTTTSSNQSAKSKAPAASSSIPAAATNSSSSASITISANDSSASQTNISVSKGTKVNLTFNVDTDGVYHGGLEFKSTDPALDSGPIKPGSSQTVSFVADKSFSFTPYWYASGVKKDYLINITVK